MITISTEDEKFLHAFETCALPAEAWTHAAHLRMAWLCLGHSPGKDGHARALARIRAGIMQYNKEVLDKLPEYHETVTVAFVRLIAARMRSAETWEQFAARNPDLFARKPPVLAAYYSKNLIQSERARASFVEPDLKALPEI